MCTLLKVANRRPVDLISPFLVHEEQIRFVGSIGGNSLVLARLFLYRPHFVRMSSVFFTRFLRFATFTIRNAMCRVHLGSRPQRNAMRLQCIADVDCEICGLFAHLYIRPSTSKMQERLSAILQPSSGPFILPVSRVQKGFNFGQDGQANIPPIFRMGSVKTSSARQTFNSFNGSY